jgi:hypothetical protein
MRILPFEPDHLKQLLLQPSQAMMQPLLDSPTYAQSLKDAGPAYSAVDGDVVFACAGFIPQWEGRAVAWALVSSEAGMRFVGITRAVRRALQLHPFRRVETAVTHDFPQGHRWAQMLGFTREGLMRSYTPDGRDCDLYARVQ